MLSELDDHRRTLVLDEASRHTQAMLTTTDVNVVPARYLSQAHRLRIEADEVLTEAVALLASPSPVAATKQKRKWRSGEESNPECFRQP